jgi:2-(1,2-epoxy-1,2-dihydrophenyl)acetyl-CoA isomerase
MYGQSITLEVVNNVGHVTLNQPERGNPFDDVFCSELCDIAIECDENPEIRAVLIRARGKYFSVGADLKWLGADRERLPYLLKSATSNLHMAVSRFARSDAPVVLAARSLVTGGSVALTAMADFAIAARSAKFYAAYNAIGFVADGSGTYFLPRRVGTRKAAEFLMLNQTWTADEALANGLVNSVVDDEQLDVEAIKLAEHLASGPTVTFGEMKRLLLSTFEQPLEAQIEQEARAIASCSKTEDSWNAIQAIMAKKPVAYRGR